MASASPSRPRRRSSPGRARPDLAPALDALVAARPTEERLLAAAARLHIDDAATEHLTHLLTTQPDWDQLVARAVAHRVAPLVYRTLSQAPFAARVPRAALTMLRDCYVINGLANLHWRRQLWRVLSALSAAGLTPILLKGAALLHTVYPDPAVRQLGDLDLLVRRSEVHIAEQRLLALGYEPAEEQWPVGSWPSDWYEKKYRPRGAEARSTIVEIHWGLVRSVAPFRITAENLLCAAEPLVVDGIEARVLCPVHQIIHLCTHMVYNDGFGVGLSRPSDLHETVERFHQRLDWGRLLAEARRLRASRCLRYALAVTSALFGTRLPTTLLASPADPPLHPFLATAALERVLANDRDRAGLPSTLATLVATDRLDLSALRQLLLPRPRHRWHSYRLLHPARLLHALRYARAARYCPLEREVTR